MACSFTVARDLLVRVFYALGDGTTPFRISILNIFLNVGLDYVLVKAFATPGLVLATVGVNIISMVIFLGMLNRRLRGLPLGQWGISVIQIAAISAIAGAISWVTSWGWERFMGTENLLLELIGLGLAVAACLGGFCLVDYAIEITRG